MKRLLLVTAGAVGFLLGSRAGRQPYEQFMRAFGQLKDDSRVQEKARQGAQLVREQAPVVADKVADAARTATDKVTSAVSGPSDSDSAHSDELIEQAVQVQKDTGPKGPLP
ncbi:YtxH domain-containing protein [Terrabacter sp. BE26]|uniref:YtxH domain-containing protein n=1 Tax=Terrabacter sp. BE26 TaxID=2898152 RepID=UPI0035BE7A25